MIDIEKKVGKPLDCWDMPDAATSILQLDQCPVLQKFWNQNPPSTSNNESPGELDISCCQNALYPPNKTYHCFPLCDRNELVGLLQLGDAPNTSPVTQQSELTAMVASQLGLVLRNIKLLDTLKVQSIRDPLTGLFNRRYLTETLEALLQRYSSSSYEVSLIMIDIDYFKRLNDTYGHPAGDSVLKDFSYFLKGLLRSTDLACRYGGEEFILILPGTPLDVAKTRAEKLCRGIKYLSMAHKGKNIGHITVSVGVATAPYHGETSAKLIQSADTALYRAKAAGRDRVVLAET